MSAYLNSNGSSYSRCLLLVNCRKLMLKISFPDTGCQKLIEVSLYFLWEASATQEAAEALSEDGKGLWSQQGWEQQTRFPLEAGVFPMAECACCWGNGIFFIDQRELESGSASPFMEPLWMKLRVFSTGLLFQKEEKAVPGLTDTAAPCSWGPNELVESKGFPSLWKRWYPPTCYHKSLKQ